MSLYCPKCWAKVSCVNSRCDERTNTVRRRYNCLQPECGYKFSSIEILPDHLDFRAKDQSVLLRLLRNLRELFQIVGPVEDEDLAAALTKELSCEARRKYGISKR